MRAERLIDDTSIFFFDQSLSSERGDPVTTFLP